MLCVAEFSVTSYKCFACLDSVTFYAAGKQMRSNFAGESDPLVWFVVSAPVSFLNALRI